MSEREKTRRRRLLQRVRGVLPDVVRKRFTLKLALVLVLMGLTVGVIGQTATNMVSAEIERNVEAEYQDTAAQQADIVEKWLQRNAISTKLSSDDDAFDDSGGASRYYVRTELATTAANLYGVQSIYIVNDSRAGPRVFASPQLPFGTYLGETSRSWITDVPFENLSVVDVHITDVQRVDGQYVVAFVSKIDNTDQRYLVIEYSVEQLTESLAGSGATSRFTQVVTDGGTIQASTQPGEVLQPYGTGAALAPLNGSRQLAANGTDRAGVITRAGPHEMVLEETYTVGYAPVRVEDTRIDWTVLVHQPTSDAFGFVHRISRWGKVATFGGIALIGLLGAAIGYTTTRDLDRLRERARAMQDGDLDVPVHSERIDAIGQLYDAFDTMRASLKAQIEAAEQARTEAEQARKEAEVSRAEAMRMNEYLQEKAEEYGAIMDKCAAGDLTQRMEPDGENEGMDQIATEFNDMVAELERTTARLKDFAADVEETGQVLQSSSESVRIASEHVADSTQTISDDAYDQKERLQNVSREIDDLVELLDDYALANEDLDIEEPLDRLTEVAQEVSAVAELSEETLAESHIVAGAAEEQAAELNEVSQRAADLSEYARPLREVLDGFETEPGAETAFDERLPLDREQAADGRGDESKD